MLLLTCQICGKSDIKSGHGLKMHQRNSPNCVAQQKAKDLLRLLPSAAKARANGAAKKKSVPEPTRRSKRVQIQFEEAEKATETVKEGMAEVLAMHRSL